jgi:hypothetical protein
MAIIFLGVCSLMLTAIKKMATDMVLGQEDGYWRKQVVPNYVSKPSQTATIICSLNCGMDVNYSSFHLFLFDSYFLTFFSSSTS